MLLQMPNLQIPLMPRRGVSKQRPTIFKQDRLWFEWFSRKFELEVRVYRMKEDGTRGGNVSVLGYPKVAGIGFSDFMQEAAHLAEREMAEYPDCEHEESHTDACRRVAN